MSEANGTAFTRQWVDERLARVLTAGRGEADGVDVLFDGLEADLVRLAEAAVTQASHLTRGRVQVRAIVDGRQGRAWTSDLTDEGLDACVKAAVTQARKAPASSERAALPAGTEAPEEAFAGGLDAPTAALTVAEKVEFLRPVLAAHDKDELALAGRFHTGRRTRAVRSSEGIGVYHHGSFSDLLLSALERPAGHRASATRARFDAAVTREQIRALGEEVRQECLRAHDPVRIDPGAWDVILAPGAMAALVEWLVDIGFGSRAFEDGTAFTAGRLGQRVTGESVTLSDDATMPDGVGVPLPFDAEGVAKRPVSLLDQGVARGIVHDSRSARRAGCQSTGHAMADPVFEAAGSVATHPRMQPGSASLDELVGQVDRGLLVTRLHYVNGLLEPRRAVMTGLLRDAAFLIEGGRITRGVQPLRFTDSILEAFDRIPGDQAIGRELEPHPIGYTGLGCGLFPHVLVRGLRFTSGRE